MQTDREHRLRDNLGQTFLYTRWPQYEEDRQLRDEAVIRHKVFAQQHLQAIAESGKDPFHYGLLDLWLNVYREPWAKPRTLAKLVDDLAEKIVSGELRVYLEDSLMWRHVSARSTISASGVNLMRSEIEGQPHRPDNARMQNEVSVVAHEPSATLSPIVIDRELSTSNSSPLELRRQRYDNRKKLLAETASVPAVSDANQRLGFNNANVLRAEAAEYVYRVDEYRRGHVGSLPAPPVGLKLIEPKSVPGLEEAVFTSKESGFGAALFESQITNEHMLVYRGTNNGVTGKKDWATNGMQGIGKETDQYNQAMDLARLAKQSLDEPFAIVGHSLGGGLASAAVAVTGLSGYTFNSAGLHPNTASRRGGLTQSETAARLQTQSVEGEVLTAAQTHGNSILTAGLTGIGAWVGGPSGAALGGLSGSLLPEVPKALGRMQELRSVSGGHPVERHKMYQVIEGIEAQKENDIVTLTNYLRTNK